MRIPPFLAHTAAHSLAQSIWTAGVLASSLVYVLVPFALHHQDAAGVLAVAPLLDATVPPTPDSSRTWASPNRSPRAGANVLPPQEAPPQEDPLPQGGWAGLPLVGGILASALNAFLPFVAARRSLARIFRMSIPVALWGAAWWFTLPGWNPGLSFLGSLLDIIQRPLNSAVVLLIHWFWNAFLSCAQQSVLSLAAAGVTLWSVLSLLFTSKAVLHERSSPILTTAASKSSATNVTVITPVPLPSAVVREHVRDVLEELSLRFSSPSTEAPLNEVDRSIALLDRLNAEGGDWARKLLRATRENGDNQAGLLALVAAAVAAPVTLATAAYRLTTKKAQSNTLQAHIESFALRSAALDIPEPCLIALFRVSLDPTSADHSAWENAASSIEDAYALARRLEAKPAPRTSSHGVAVIAPLKSAPRPTKTKPTTTPAQGAIPTQACAAICAIADPTGFAPKLAPNPSCAVVHAPSGYTFLKVDPNNPILTAEQEVLVEQATREAHPPNAHDCSWTSEGPPIPWTPEPPSAPQAVNAALPSANKVNLAYFLFTATIRSPTREARVTVLVDTGASGNFIDMRLARSLELNLAPIDHVLGASSEPMQCATSLDPLVIAANGHCFTETVRAIPGLIYPLIVGVGWWRENAVRIDLENDLIWFTSPGSSGSIPLLTDVPASETMSMVASPKEEEPFLLPAILGPYRRAFDAKAATALPPHSKHDLSFKLTVDLIKIDCPLYPLTEQEDAVLAAWIDEMLAKKYIFKKFSSVSSPVVFASKSDGSLRPCVDYGHLNNLTVPDPYPLPHEATIAQSIAKSRVFSKLDLVNAFNQVRVAEGQEWLTAIRTRRGCFQFRVMPFGLKNAPATFQRVIDEALGDLRFTCAVAYVDDILIHSPDEQTHARDLVKVVAAIHAAGLFIKPSKCEFFKKEVTWLGNMVLAEGHAVSPSKTEAILNWSTPTTQKQVRCFLGTVIFLKKFSPAISQLAAPLHPLTGNGAKFVWNQEHQAAFEALKQAFVSTPVLRHADVDKPFIVACDSSDVALGAVLLQEHDGVEHPVAYFSKKLGQAEQAWMIYDKELAAVHQALLHWRHLLQGARHEFIVRTDHQSLTFFRKPQNLLPRQVRVLMFLLGFKFKYQFVKGSLNILPDMLSRNPSMAKANGDTDSPVTVVPNSQVLSPTPLLVIAASNTLPPTDADSLLDHVLYAQLNEADGQAALTLLANPKAKSPLCLKESVVYHNSKVWVPAALRERVVREHHDPPTMGHPGSRKCLDLIRRTYSWPGITKHVGEWVKRCVLCARSKPDRSGNNGLLRPLQQAAGPWSSISVDFVTQLPPSRGFDAIMVVVDRFTKYSIFIPCMTALSTLDTAQLFIDHVFTQFGLPQEIISDRGPQFTSRLWEALLPLLQIRPCRSTAYHPQSDGQTERVNQTMEQYLRCYSNSAQDRWASDLSLAQFSYNNSVHSSTGMSPFEANLGYSPSFALGPKIASEVPAATELVAHLKKVHQQVSASLSKAIAAYKKAADKSRRPAPDYQVGSLVMLSASNIKIKVPTRKLGPKRLGPFTITKDLKNGSFTLDVPPQWGLHNTFHTSLLSPFCGPLPKDPDPVIVEGVPEYEVSEIVSSRRVKRSIQYCVAWKGYPAYDNSWVPARDCTNCADLIEAFHKANPSAPRPSQEVAHILAIKLPKAHKNFALATIPDGGITPRERGKGDVRSRPSLISLDRTLHPRRRRRQQNPKAHPLSDQADLAHVLDERWVSATHAAPVNPPAQARPTSYAQAAAAGPASPAARLPPRPSQPRARPIAPGLRLEPRPHGRDLPRPSRPRPRARSAPRPASSPRSRARGHLGLAARDPLEPEAASLGLEPARGPEPIAPARRPNAHRPAPARPDAPSGRRAPIRLSPPPSSPIRVGGRSPKRDPASLARRAAAAPPRHHPQNPVPLLMARAARQPLARFPGLLAPPAEGQQQWRPGIEPAPAACSWPPYWLASPPPQKTSQPPKNFLAEV